MLDEKKKQIQFNENLCQEENAATKSPSNSTMHALSIGLSDFIKVCATWEVSFMKISIIFKLFLSLMWNFRSKIA